MMTMSTCQPLVALLGLQTVTSQGLITLESVQGGVEAGMGGRGNAATRGWQVDIVIIGNGTGEVALVTSIIP